MQKPVVDEVAPEGGVVGMDRRKSLVDLLFGVGLTRLEPVREPVEHHQSLAVDGRDLDEPAVTYEYSEYPVGLGSWGRQVMPPSVGASAGLGAIRLVGPIEGLVRFPEAFGAQHVGIAVLVDETGAGEAGQCFRRTAQIEAGGSSDLGDGGWAGAEDESGNGAQTIVIGEQAEESGGFGAHGRGPG